MWSMSGAIAWPYQSLYIIALGGSKPIIGLINSIAAFASILLFPIGGYIADKAGRVKFVGIATFIYTVGFIPFIFASSWELLAFGVIFQQVVVFYVPALLAITADSVPTGARGKIYSLTLILPQAIRILTPYLGGFLISVYTLQTAMRIGYILGFIFGCIVAFIRYRFLKETIENREPIGRDIPKIFRASYSNLFSSLKWVISNLKGYSIIQTLLSLIGSMIMPFWVVYATEIGGLSEYYWGTILLLSGIVNTALSYFIGGIVDRIGTKKCIITAFILAIPSMAFFTIASSFLQIFLIYLAVTISSAFIRIASFVYLADNIPRKMRGRVLAVVGQGMMIGGSALLYGGFIVFIPIIFGSMVGGFIYNINPVYPWLIQVIFLTISLFLSIFLIKKTEKVED
jgi:DHA1 family multidrug resistance protein-like MFS transporter